MISKRKILRISIISCITLVVMVVGMFVTNSYEFTISNFIVGSFAAIFVSFVGHLMTLVTDALIAQLPKELLDDDGDIEVHPYKTVQELEEELRLENLIKPMSDNEFYLFLSRDRYGDDKPDRDAILNLLEQIKGVPEYESKEKIIYKKLQEIK
jgi:hypothetical protein